LYKENNMLLTEQQLSRRRGIIFPQPDRIQKVKKSLGAIRQVMGERKREKLSQMALQQMEEDDGGLDDKTTEKVAP
jgi:large subunit ribosomal protein L47